MKVVLSDGETHRELELTELADPWWGVDLEWHEEPFAIKDPDLPLTYVHTGRRDAEGRWIYTPQYWSR